MWTEPGGLALAASISSSWPRPLSSEDVFVTLEQQPDRSYPDLVARHAVAAAQPWEQEGASGPQHRRAAHLQASAAMQGLCGGPIGGQV